jgi:hypothetical protein
VGKRSGRDPDKVPHSKALKLDQRISPIIPEPRPESRQQTTFLPLSPSFPLRRKYLRMNGRKRVLEELLVD